MKATSTPKKSPAKKEALSQYYNLLLQTPVPIAIFRGNNYIVELANDSALGVIVKDKRFIGKPLFEAMPELEHPIKEIFDKLMQTGIPFQANEMELTLYRNGKNETCWFNLNYQPIREDDNTISGIITSANEVTEQVLARKKIEDCEKRYNMMLMKSPFGFAAFKGKNMVITLANDTIKEIWGKGKDVEGKPLFDVLPELKDTAYPGLLADVYTTGVPFQGNEILASFLSDGKIEDKYFNLVYQPYLEADETISGVTVVAHEVTGEVILKKALEAQHEAEQKTLKLVEETNNRYYTMLMDSPFAFSVMKGKDMVITLANSLMKEFWGKGTDVEGKSLLQLLPELIDQPFPEMIEKVYTTGMPVYANEILGKLTYNGQLNHKYFNVVFQPYYEADNSISGVTTIAYDVTEMILARKKIEESDKRYNLMLMHSPFTFVVLKGKDLVVALANDRIKGVWGRGNDVEGKPLLAIMPELSDTPFPALMDEVMATGIPFHGKEVQSPHNTDGHAREEYFNFVFQPYWEADQTISGITIIGYDVTEQVIAKKKTEESEERFQAAVAAVEGIVWTNNAKGEMEGAQIGWGSLTGQNYEAYHGYGWADAIHPDEAQPTLDAWNEAVRDRKNFVFEHRVKYKNGNWGHFSVNAIPLLNADESIREWVGVHTDISERKLAEDKLKESEERFRFLVMQAPVSICVLRGEDLIIETMNQEMANLLDRKIEDSLNKPLFDVVTEVKNQVYKELLDTVYKTGTRFVSQELPLVVNRNGRLDNAFVKFVYEPLREADGTISGVMVLADEITDQVNARKRIEAQVIMHEDMLMNAPYVICTLDGPNHVYSFVNEQYQQLFGSRILKGKPFLEAIPEFEGQGFDKILDNIYNTGETFVGNDIPATFPKEEGGTSELRYFNFSYQPMFDENLKIYSILGFGYEVTETVNARKRIEVSEKKFRLLTNNMPQKITNADAEGNVIFFNQQWLDHTGLAFDELVEYGWVKTMHPDDLELTVNTWKHSVATGEVFDMECRIQNKEGDYIWHLSRAVPVKDETGKILMWVGSNTDIHEQKEQKEGLQHAVAVRTLELSEVNEELIKMNKELKAFSYVSSHDLQEPLRKIQTFASIILEKENENLSDSGKNYFRLIQNSAQRMQTLIQDLLEFSRLSISDRKFENTNLNVIIEEVKNEFKEAIAEKNATVEVSEICEAKIIPFQFRQLMHNLISNALKFSNPTIPPHIIVKSHIVQYSKTNVANLTLQTAYCHISISDNGIGFKKEYAERIFEVFQKLHSKDEYAGTGIGLAIVKKVVENHNGVITATSELNKGTTFNIYIPA